MIFREKAVKFIDLGTDIFISKLCAVDYMRSTNCVTFFHVNFG